MFNYTKYPLKIQAFLLLLMALSPSFSEEGQSQNYIGIAFDYNEAPALRSKIFAPFITEGEIPISENNLPYESISLPEPLPPFWDVVSLNADQLERYCATGALTPLNWANFPHKDLLIPTALESCGVGHSVSSTVLSYSVLHRYGLPPSGWRDFFDFNRFPGKRALPLHGRGVFEAALLADGVPKDEIYTVLATEEGLSRAQAQLDRLKGNLLWWEEISELREWLLNGQVALGLSPDAPLLYGEGLDNIGIVRNEAIYRIRYYAIPAHSENKQLAYAYISYATHPMRQRALYQVLPYGPTLKQGWNLFSEREQEALTNAPKNIRYGIAEDRDFYLEHGERLEKRYQEWYSSQNITIKAIDVGYQVEEEEEAAPAILIDPNFIGPPEPIIEKSEPITEEVDEALEVQESLDSTLDAKEEEEVEFGPQPLATDEEVQEEGEELKTSDEHIIKDAIIDDEQLELDTEAFLKQAVESVETLKE